MCDKQAPRQRTLGDVFATEDLGNFLLNELVALLADLDNLGAGNAELGYIGKDLLGNLGGRLVLGDGIRVVESVV